MMPLKLKDTSSLRWARIDLCNFRSQEHVKCHGHVSHVIMKLHSRRGQIRGRGNDAHEVDEHDVCRGHDGLPGWMVTLP